METYRISIGQFLKESVLTLGKKEEKVNLEVVGERFSDHVISRYFLILSIHDLG